MLLLGNAKCRLSKDARLAVRNEVGILLDVGGGKYYSLTPVATSVCLFLKDGIAFDSLVNLLTDRYTVAPEILQGDVTKFLTDLHARSLCILTEE